MHHTGRAALPLQNEAMEPPTTGLPACAATKAHTRYAVRFPAAREPATEWSDGMLRSQHDGYYE
jgi:hypothetical protein